MLQNILIFLFVLSLLFIYNSYTESFQTYLEHVELDNHNHNLLVNDIYETKENIGDKHTTFMKTSDILERNNISQSHIVPENNKCSQLELCGTFYTDNLISNKAGDYSNKSYLILPNKVRVGNFYGLRNNIVSDGVIQN